MIKNLGMSHEDLLEGARAEATKRAHDYRDNYRNGARHESKPIYRRIEAAARYMPMEAEEQIRCERVFSRRFDTLIEARDKGKFERGSLARLVDDVKAATRQGFNTDSLQEKYRLLAARYGLPF